jgi:hypothetical protein
MKDRIINLLVRIYVAVKSIVFTVKYFFRVENDKADKRRRRLILIPFAVMMTAAFITMYAIVYTRSYNIMNADKLIVFDYDEAEEVITVLGRSFSINTNVQ